MCVCELCDDGIHILLLRKCVCFTVKLGFYLKLMNGVLKMKVRQRQKMKITVTGRLCIVND